MEEEEKKEESKNYELKEVATEYGIAIFDPEGKQMTFDQAIVQLLNDVNNIKEIVR